MAILVFVGLTTIAISLLYLYLKRHYARSIDDLPGEEPHIFFGNLITTGLLRNKTTFHEVLLDYQRRYGDKFMFWFGSYPCLVFCLPEHARTIFSDRQTFEQSPLFLPNFDLLCPHGIFLLTGSKWKRHIRVMLPVFKRAKITHYLDTIIECTDRFIEQHLHNNQIHKDLKKHCQSLLMNIIGFIAFSYDFNTALDVSLKDALEDFGFQSSLLMSIPWTPRWLIKFYLKLNWRYQRSHRLIRELTEKILQNEFDNPNTIEDRRSKNLITSLASSLNEQADDEKTSSGLTRAEILDEILASILAGYGTTYTALAWFIFYTSKYPHVQQRMKDELRDHHLLITDDTECFPPLTQDILDSLTYCECVTKEVLRLAPIAGATTRIALHDTMVDNVPVRRGQTVLIALNNMNTDARYWHHAKSTAFVPERFLNEDKDHHPYSMLPFGGGHRACIGQELAWFELKIIIVRLMQRGVTFEDTSENLVGYEEHVTCEPKHLVVRVRMDESNRG